MSLSDILTFTLSKYTNSTGSTISSLTESKMSLSDSIKVTVMPGFSIDDAILSMSFDSLENGTSTGDVQINNASSLQLDGDHDFVHVNNTSTNNLRSLVLSAWVKPDYSEGSPEFTVVSKEKSFSLAVENQISSHGAKFSIFDGIKWSTVESISEIPEEWTHLTASLSNQTISILTLESVQIESISSDGEIIVGAYMTTKSNILQPNNMFSGIIDDVLLFDILITESQIRQLYNQGLDTHSLFEPKTIEEILKEIELEAQIQAQNSTNPIIQAQLGLSDSLDYSLSQAQNSTNPIIQAQLGLSDSLEYSLSQAQNGTDFISLNLTANPTLEPIKDTYLMTEQPEIIFEFYDESDVFSLELGDLESALNTVDSETLGTIRAQNGTSNDLDSIAGFIGILSIMIPEADAAKNDDASVKSKIKQLKKEIKQLKKNDTLSEDQVKNLKDKLKLLVSQIKDESKNKQKPKLDSAINKIEKITNKSKETQKNSWKGNNENISVEIFDSHNNKINFETELVKEREGKFNIKIDTQNTKPGLYKIKTILNVNGEEHITENEFAWGLVSVNTIKSIYKPNDVADLEIVVLNSTGNPVCDSNITMNIVDPNLSSTTLTSNDKITSEPSCGLYSANYQTQNSGNYTIDIQAETETGIANFSTYFIVQESFDYDVTRYAESVIDPINNPNRFVVGIQVESFVGNGPITVREYVPSFFDIITEGDVEIVGDNKVITWTKSLTNNVAAFEYVYSVPLETPQLYALGQAEVEQDGVPTFTEARNWFVAIDPQVVLDTQLSSSNAANGKSSRNIVSINATHMYDFFIDNGQDVNYGFSTDGGATWTAGTDIVTGTHFAVGVWYDRWTPGDTGNDIHIAYLDSKPSQGPNSGGNEIYYVALDTLTNTIGTPVGTVSTNNQTDGFNYPENTLTVGNDISITKGTDGDLYVGTVSLNDAYTGTSPIRKCPAPLDCTVDTNWTQAASISNPHLQPWSSTQDGDDALMLLPLDDGTNDIMLVSHDIGLNGLNYTIYDDSSPSWDLWAQIDTNIFESSAWQHTHSAMVDPNSGNLYLTTVNNTGVLNSGEILAYKYTTSWSSLTDPFAADSTSEIFDAQIGIDTITDDLYVAFSKSTTGEANQDVFVKVSTDDGTSWGSERKLTNSQDDYENISIDMSNDESLYVTIHDDPRNDLDGNWALKRLKLLEALSISDSLTTTKSVSQTLSESLALSDTLTTTKSVSQTLSESLALSDSLTTTKSVTQSLSESLSLTDAVSASKSVSQTLTDSLSLTDAVATTK
jgi:hypothetical protein